MNPDEFDACVEAAVDSIPADLARAMDNVAIFIEDEYIPGRMRIRTPNCWASTRAPR